MYIEDDYIEDVYNELINAKSHTNIEDEPEINEEPMDQQKDLKIKLKNDNEFKIEPQKFKTNDTLNIQYINNSIKINTNHSKEVEIIVITPMHPRERLERKNRNELKITGVNSFHPRDRLTKKIRNNEKNDEVKITD